MRSFITKLIDLVLYGNFWIAACALALALQTQLILSGAISWNVDVGFIGFSTFLLYAIHKIVGIRKMHAFKDRGRFAVISRYRSHIILYSIIAVAGTGYFFFHLHPIKKLLVAIPAILSLLYVLPLPKLGLRLRDIHYLKIFLVAFVWAWVTVFLAAPFYEWSLLQELWPVFLERAFFIFAITLPFDIRDMTIDQHAGLQTLPHELGLSNTKMLIALSLIIAMLLAMWNAHTGFYPPLVLTALCIHYGLTYVFAHFSDQVSHDYYFSGVIDGTMILQFVFVCLAIY